MSELKCCPFCSSNNIKIGSVGTSFGIDNYIKCVDCGAKIQICDEYGMERLEELWNRRKPMANIVEKLEENSFDMSLENPDCKAIWTDKAINIVKQEINNGLE